MCVANGSRGPAKPSSSFSRLRLASAVLYTSMILLITLLPPVAGEVSSTVGEPHLEEIAAETLQGFDVQEPQVGQLQGDGSGENIDPFAREQQTRLTERLKCDLSVAEGGDTEMQYWCAWAYSYGADGFVADKSEAMRWYKEAALAGHAAAMNNLGSGLSKGEGVHRDYAEAAKWFGEAARQKHPQAMNNYAQALATGKGVKRDPHRAVKMWEHAAELGEVGAMYNLGLAHQTGVGVFARLKEAQRWYERAASRGHKLAAFSIGEIFEFQLDDKNQALYWYKVAGEKGLEDGKRAFVRLLKETSEEIKDAVENLVPSTSGAEHGEGAREEL